MAEGDAHGTHRPVHEGEVEDQIAAVEEHQAHDCADDVKGDVDHRHPLGIAVDADGAEQRGDAGADILAHDDGDGHAVGDGTGQRQSLQNAHGRGGGLDDAGKHGTHQHAQQRILESGEQAGKFRHIRQGTDSVAHEFHAVHQNGKAHHDAAHIPALLPFGSHDEDDARQGHQGRKVLRLEHVHEDALALDAGEGEDPRGEGGADVGAHDDTDGLAQLHDAGVHKAHQHHGHGG